MYYVYPKIGNTITGPPTAMSPEEYKQYMLATQTKAYDIKTGMYYVYPKIGNTITGPPTAMSPEEYKQ
ncbi:hypothetical protein, partial [Chryseobacterium sp. CH1]|uniref:hypothetical protein n=1 Tax=Chryseobacterium sp. CH1 TaxID=713551 RepID=UPI001027FFDF